MSRSAMRVTLTATSNWAVCSLALSGSLYITSAMAPASAGIPVDIAEARSGTEYF